MQGDFLGKDKAKQKRKKQQRPKPRGGGQANAPQPAHPPPHGFSAALKPLASLVVNESGHLHCPPPIVALRAAVARTPLCKALRPQALPFKLAACGLLSAMVNIPPGMAKTHFEKFSPGWFVAIHVSIPFVAALRKAVHMPPAALAVTLGGAIAGALP